MSVRTALKALLGTAWHVRGDDVADALTVAADGTVEANKPVIVDASKKVDTWDATILKANGVIITNAIAGVGASYKIARGSAAALDGSNPTPIATGLTTIVSAIVQLRGTAAPGDNTSVLTTDYTGSDGTLNVYAWKNTSGSDPTLVASTGTETFDWIAIGT